MYSESSTFFQHELQITPLSWGCVEVVQEGKYDRTTLCIVADIIIYITAWVFDELLKKRCNLISLCHLSACESVQNWISQIISTGSL